MPFAFGDIYLVEFDPSVGHEYQNIRPGFVIQEEEISKISPYITVLPITSQIEKHAGVDVFIERDNKNRLSVDSIIKVRHISSFDKSRFMHFIGKAGSPTIRQVRGYLRRHFGL
ncbi:MAG: type II toxin-antitoxin system PemK/MazF family toxin [Patescibacteria group bacterium]